MGYYKDYSYVKFILDLPFERGFKLYLKCLNHIKEDKEEILKERIFKIWLIEIQNGYKGDFEKYYQDKIKKAETSNLTFEEKILEEKRIHTKIKIKKHAKMEEVKFNL